MNPDQMVTVAPWISVAVFFRTSPCIFTAIKHNRRTEHLHRAPRTFGYTAYIPHIIHAYHINNQHTHFSISRLTYNDSVTSSSPALLFLGVNAQETRLRDRWITEIRAAGLDSLGLRRGADHRGPSSSRSVGQFQRL